MKYLKIVFILSGLALALAASTWNVQAWAQRSSSVQFRPGNYGTILSGAITGREYFDYRLTARKGQKLFAELSVAGKNGARSIYFNILPPGSNGEAIFIGHMHDGNTANVTLPASGTYIIRVYLMGNDKDTGKTVVYNLDVSIQ